MRHENNFDLLRFALAFAVFLVHSHVLSQHPDLRLLGSWVSSDIAVKGFFVVSGYLVFMSYENAASLRDYFEKRARRIYPAYFTVIFICAVIGLFLTSQSLSDYLSWDLARYLAANLSFLNFFAPTLPGVFSENPVNAVNGPLWTLKIEVMFYLSVPVIAVVAKKSNRLLIFVAIYVLSVAYSLAMLHLLRTTGNPIYEVLARQLPGQMTYFTAGAIFYYYRNELAGYMNLLLAAAAAIYLLQGTAVVLVLEPLALGTMVIYFATRLPYLGNFGKYGDLSYGVYIIHFPMLQGMVALGLFRGDAPFALALATLIVLSAALLSWHLVEKKWLKKSSHYVIVSSQPAHEAAQPRQQQ